VLPVVLHLGGTAAQADKVYHRIMLLEVASTCEHFYELIEVELDAVRESEKGYGV
jgi:hypothetical protein